MEITLSEDKKSILINSSDNFYTVKGVAFKNFKQLCDYQKELISILIKYLGNIESTLEDAKCINIIKKINKLMFNEIDNFLDELTVHDIFKLYFTSNESLNEYGTIELTKLSQKDDKDTENRVLNIQPSFISVVNGMDFFSAVTQALEKRQKEVTQD